MLNKVKLMDTGTAMFRAESREQAEEKLLDALRLGGDKVTIEEDTYILDFSTWRYWQFIQARLEPASFPGKWAAVLRTGDAPKLPFDLPSKQAVSLTKAILKALGE